MEGQPPAPADPRAQEPDAAIAPQPPPALLRLIAPALVLTALLVALGAYLIRQGPGAAAPAGDDALVGFVLDPPREAPAFTLTSHTGAPTSLADARGKAVLLFFGFTSCPDVCPTTMLTIARALGELGAEGDRVVPVLVSVDPERDTTSVLAEYVAGYDPRIVGATADLPVLTAMAEDYGIRFEKVVPEGAGATGGDYTMDHSATIFLIDPAGRLRAAYLEPTPDDLAHDLAVVLAE